MITEFDVTQLMPGPELDALVAIGLGIEIAWVLIELKTEDGDWSDSYPAVKNLLDSNRELEGYGVKPIINDHLPMFSEDLTSLIASEPPEWRWEEKQGVWAVESILGILSKIGAIDRIVPVAGGAASYKECSSWSRAKTTALARSRAIGRYAVSSKGGKIDNGTVRMVRKVLGE